MWSRAAPSSTSRLSRVAMVRGLRVISEPPLPSPLAAGDRSGAISSDPDFFSSRKLQGKHGLFRQRDVVPMWIADMDYRCPDPVIEAVVACAKRGIFGYTNPPLSLTPLTLQRLASVYGCNMAKAEWIGWLSGLVPGLSHAVRVAIHRAEQAGRTEQIGVAVLTPAYPPFLSMPGFNRAMLESVPLVETPMNCDLHGALDDAAAASVVRFEIDWPALEACLSKPSTSLLLLWWVRKTHSCTPCRLSVARTHVRARTSFTPTPPQQPAQPHGPVLEPRRYCTRRGPLRGVRRALVLG